MIGVTVRKINQIKDNKGTTIEWCKGEEGKQVTIYERAKGTYFAQHYHKGNDPSKNPEIFFLLKGTIEFIFIDPVSGNKENLIIQPYEEVRIKPRIKHLAYALEDALFLEYRATPFQKKTPDTYPVPLSDFIS